MNSFKEILTEVDLTFEHLYSKNISEYLTKILEGEIEVNTSAIFATFRSFERIISKVDCAIENILTDDSDTHRKDLMVKACLLSRYVSLAIIPPFQEIES